MTDDSATPPLWHGILLALGIYLLSICLHAILPGANVVGYAFSERHIGSRLSYKLNGNLVTIISLAFAISLPIVLFRKEDDALSNHQRWSLAAAFYYRHFFGLVLGGNIWGILLSVFFYQRGLRWSQENNYLDQERLRCPTEEKRSRGVLRKRSRYSWLAFYRGVGEFNPRVRVFFFHDVDIKMCLYLAGTIMLQLQVGTMAVAHAIYYNNGHMSRAMGLSSLGWTWFCVDYLSDEHVHLYTYDIFAERIGIKLAWGCLCVYPFLYPFGQSVLVRTIEEGDDLSRPMTIGIALMFLLGWMLTRGANYQKYMFKKDPRRKSILGGLIQQQIMTVPIQDDKTGTSEPRHLLVSGFWGLARHVNYLGEILQGLALGLPGLIVTQSPISLVYFCFITAILIPRQVDDDKLCRAKYGDKAWDAYTQLVPYKIIPGVY
jgi:hypothetical protein